MTSEKSAILTELYKSPEVDNCIWKMVGQTNREDFKQELFIIIADIDEKLLIRLHGEKKLKYYVVRVIINMVRWKRSIYQKKYVEPGRVIPIDGVQVGSEEIDITAREQHEEREDRIIKEVNRLDDVFKSPYYALLVNYLQNDWSMRELAEATGISVSAISRGIKKVREHLNKIQ